MSFEIAYAISLGVLALFFLLMGYINAGRKIEGVGDLSTLFYLIAFVVAMSGVLTSWGSYLSIDVTHTTKMAIPNEPWFNNETQEWVLANETCCSWIENSATEHVLAPNMSAFFDGLMYILLIVFMAVVLLGTIAGFVYIINRIAGWVNK